MELFWRYLKGHKRTFLAETVFFLIFLSSFLLYHLPLEAVVYPALVCVCIGICICVFDCLRVKREHEILLRIQALADIAAENFPEVHSIAEKDYQEILTLLGEQHKRYSSEENQKYEDMIQYYTVWAHQIKTPIASMRLHLQNEDSALSRKLTSDLHRVEQYVEMVLTFLRLNSESTDYVFKEYDLDMIIKSAVRKFSSDFIERRLRLIYEPVNITVVTDEKWLSFVIEQVLSNALKYTPSGTITISLVGKKTLRIEDTGIGIAQEDLPRIFENGYTGYNGRINQKSSGIGLYLCKRICMNLEHQIKAESEVGVGTAVEINLFQ